MVVSHVSESSLYPIRSVTSNIWIRPIDNVKGTMSFFLKSIRTAEVELKAFQSGFYPGDLKVPAVLCTLMIQFSALYIFDAGLQQNYAKNLLLSVI